MYLLPTLSRPKNLKRFIQTYIDTDAIEPIFVRLHQDDPDLAANVMLLKSHAPPEWDWTIGPNLAAAGCMNEFFRAKPDLYYYGFIGDDCIPKTPEWDTQLANACGPWGISWPDDLHHGQELCTHPVCGGDLIRAIGWWALPGLDHNGVDVILWHIANQLKELHYCADVIFDHAHHLFKKADFDQVYERGLQYKAADDALGGNFLRGRDFVELVERLREAHGRDKPKK